MTRRETRPEHSHPVPITAFGGPSFPERTADHRSELGTLWGDFRVGSEWKPLRHVLLHRPGEEIRSVTDADAALMAAIPDPDVVTAQHDAMAEAYRAQGVTVHYVEPPVTPPPNQMFAADLMFMTPDGAIVGRPASTVRAGEERWVARKLADLGIPILRTISGTGVFEGADAFWMDPHTVVIGRGLRTNEAGAEQVAWTLDEMDVQAVLVDLPHGCMHLMGEIRIVDGDLAWVRSHRVPWSVIHALESRGYEVHFFPSEEENERGMAYNFVTLGPRKILMPAGNPISEAAYREQGMEVVTVEMSEVVKAAGAVGCLSAILSRKE
ncbi:MAG: arginine deiminase family protein [Gemmatimonadota bacterium]|nr:arginine deiminase family protein [Gemmatimonadota bacterium]